MRTLTRPFPALTARQTLALAALAAALLLALAAAVAQIVGDRGIAPVAASQDIHVTGIEVDAKGDTPEKAREAGWAEAARLAWAKINGPKLSDGQIAGLVSAIEVESEQLGPKRYIARLGVIFDRTRAQGYLGGAGNVARSAPLMLVPVLVTGGTATVYERRNPWQRAWAEFQTGQSRIDYVRPSGANGDSLLVNFGQTGRRSRLWWRSVLDQFGASDVIVAIARLDYSYPGGPVTGHFTARYGPDSTWLGEFTLKAASPAQLPAMLTQAVTQFDAVFTQALSEGKLKPDPTLNLENPVLPPEVEALIAQGRAAAARDAAESAATLPDEPSALPGDPTIPAPNGTTAPVPVVTYTVQFATPDPASVDTGVASVRAATGVRTASTSSLALGGTSMMRVTYAGSLADLAAALKARGFTVREVGNGLSISR